ncbi:MAG: beta-lactamase family protein [Treponema sp.]|jgi:CubicO group peptidase (beta-lactamase class C family)|nr:beta-lactamase family protein [Treponema sp.]
MKIKPFVQSIEKQKLNCEGVVVLQHGERIASHRWIPETPRTCYSVSKSFVSIAIGIAIAEGKLSLKTRALDLFDAPNSAPKDLASLNLEHLLTMTRGHEEFSRPPSVAEALKQRLVYKPGSRFVYDNGSTFLASAMFTKAVGKTVRDYLVDALFRPLGIPDPVWKESEDGHTVGASGLEITTSSMAVFGQFLLQRGNWQGKQLVPPEWIDSAGRPHASTSADDRADCDLGYGYCFWSGRYGTFRADGKKGQFVVVLPLQDAVVAINSSEEKHIPVLYTVWDTILGQL